MILLKDDVFKKAFITHAVAVNKHAFSAIIAAFFLIFCKSSLIFYTHVITLMATIICFFCYLILMLIHLNSKISHHVKNLNT